MEKCVIFLINQIKATIIFTFLSDYKIENLNNLKARNKYCDKILEYVSLFIIEH